MTRLKRQLNGPIIWEPPDDGKNNYDSEGTPGPWNYRKIHHYGHVYLEDHMGGDLTIANNARVSFNQNSQELGDSEKGLIKFLMKNRHGSPFEAPTFRFDIKLPLFVVREWHRHRVGHSYNEQSARYSVIKSEGYLPKRDDIRIQVGKPGAYTFERVEDDSQAQTYIEAVSDSYASSFSAYQFLIEEGFAKELARVVLPVGMYTRMKWTTNLRAILHFLSLRNSEHAQREIRAYAEAVEEMVARIAPVALQAFIDNGRVCP